jgi:methylase of polypeptide subunit release factors
VEVTLRHSDLFEALGGERYDAVLFNPPFHDASPASAEEAAWCGGAVVRRFLLDLPAHLTPRGAAWILLPRAEQRRYAPELAAYASAAVAGRWFPVMGRVELLSLRPRGGPG